MVHSLTDGNTSKEIGHTSGLDVVPTHNMTIEEDFQVLLALVEDNPAHIYEQNKPELQSLLDHYQIPYIPQELVIEMKRKLVNFLHTKPPTKSLLHSAQGEVDMDPAVRIEKMRMDERREIRAADQAQRDHELRIQESKEKVRLAEIGMSNGQGGGPKIFNAASHVRLVPKFDEKYVDEFFQNFETVARTSVWPEAYWSVLAQQAFTGKAHQTFASLNFEDASNYYSLKAAILRAYQLTPEEYRKRFHDTKKYSTESYTEYCHRIKVNFDKWARSMSVAKYEDLKELFLMDHLKANLPVNLNIHLETQKIRTLTEAAIEADEFTCLHKSEHVKWNGPVESCPDDDLQDQEIGVYSKQYQPSRSLSPPRQSDSKPSFVSKQPKFRVPMRDMYNKCFKCHKEGHFIADCAQNQSDTEK